MLTRVLTTLMFVGSLKMTMGDCWLSFRGDDPGWQGFTKVNVFDWVISTNNVD
jgi:hypothetical protein